MQIHSLLVYFPSTATEVSVQQSLTITMDCLQAMEADAPLLNDASDNKRLVKQPPFSCCTN